MSAASNDNEQGSDLDEPMASQSQVLNIIWFINWLIKIEYFSAAIEKESEWY